MQNFNFPISGPVCQRISTSNSRSRSAAPVLTELRSRMEYFVHDASPPARHEFFVYAVAPWLSSAVLQRVGAQCRCFALLR